MTPQEYMDPKLFPNTTQAGIGLKDQLLIDAVNYDDVTRYEQEGRPIPADKAAVVAELRAKHAARPAVMAEAKAKGLL